MVELTKKKESQLNFITSVFKLCIKELIDTMGPESIQTIFRLIGSGQGEAAEKRIKEQNNITDWTVEQFADIFAKQVLDPALGEGQSEIKIDNSELKVIIKVCPFNDIGIDISNKICCSYTKGLIQTAANKALKNIEFNSEHLQSDGSSECSFRVLVNK